MITEGKTEHMVRFRPRRLGHANLFVSDLDRSMRFYNAVCGLEEVRREPAIRIGFLSNGNTHHDVGLVQSSTARRVGRGGFGRYVLGSPRAMPAIVCPEGVVAFGP